MIKSYIYKLFKCLFILLFFIPTVLYSDNETPENAILVQDSDTARVSIVEAFEVFKSPLYKDPGLPAFTMVSRNKNLALGIGGYLRLTASCDFAGIVDSRDFVPFLIPVPRRDNQKSAYTMDVSTSRIFMRVLIQTKSGTINLYMDTDFRGENDRYEFSSAYINWNGLLIGRNWSIISDLKTFPPSVDFQGPNAFCGTFTNQISLERTIGRNFMYGISLEMPEYSIADSLMQYNRAQNIPTMPVYIGLKNSYGHVRIGALLRALEYDGVLTGKGKKAFTWGTILSSNFKPLRKTNIFLQSVYGKGISDYIFDLGGNGLDLIRLGENSDKLHPIPIFGFFGGIKYDFSDTFQFSSTYSQMRVYKVGEWQPNLYRLGQYVAVTFYYNLTGNLQYAFEYNYGRYEWQNGETGSANRLQMMLRYNF